MAEGLSSGELLEERDVVVTVLWPVLLQPWCGPSAGRCGQILAGDDPGQTHAERPADRQGDRPATC